jgi:FixJ family two-component response regulator
MNMRQPPILVVDDDTAVLDVLGGQIALAGYEVMAFDSPHEALESLRRTSFAAVISDFKMPEMCGLDLLGRVREIQPGATRILVTGVLSIDRLLGSIECGLLHRFLAKPWARVELLAAVESAVQHYRLLDENHRLRAEVDRLSCELNASDAKIEVMFDQLTRRESGGREMPRPVREVEPSELRPGMTVARAVTTSSGSLLLESGAELTPATIDRLRAPGSLPANGQRVLVYERLTVCG